jgi:hypothetical protein
MLIKKIKEGWDRCWIDIDLYGYMGMDQYLLIPFLVG